jgi:nucleoid DNA-binding protein
MPSYASLPVKNPGTMTTRRPRSRAARAVPRALADISKSIARAFAPRPRPRVAARAADVARHRCVVFLSLVHERRDAIRAVVARRGVVLRRRAMRAKRPSRARVTSRQHGVLLRLVLRRPRQSRAVAEECEDTVFGASFERPRRRARASRRAKTTEKMKIATQRAARVSTDFW